MERIPLACSNPFLRYNPLKNCYDRIPCGWCLSCRIDKRNYYSDKFEYAYYKDFNGVGSFTCITYDDNHIPLNPQKTHFTLKKQDSIKFIKRLRSYINYHNLDCNLINKNFKFFACGEYGGQFGRPHMHYIFVGLDYSVLDDLLPNCWSKGIIIDNGPILKGGIRYVMKYMDKQQHGSELDVYTDNGIEPPFMHCSHNFSKGLYNTGNENYYIWKNRKRPLPIWIKNKRCLPSDETYNDNIKQFALDNKLSYDDADYYLRKSKLLNLEHTAQFNNEPVDSALNDVPRLNRSLEVRSSRSRK